MMADNPEVRIGELMSQVPKELGRRNDIKPMDSDVQRLKPTRADIIEQAGFTLKQVQRFETLAANLDMVEQAKAEARENDDIVSRSLVLNMIKSKKKEEQLARAKQSIQ